MVEKATAALALGLALASVGRPAWAWADETPAATCQAAMVKDIRPGPQGGIPGASSSAPAVLGGSIFFAADDGQRGTELWKSDGTPSGTVMVKDILPGAGGADPHPLIAAGGRLYFVADDGVHGRELWTSDGTPGGTRLVRDIRPGTASSVPDLFTPMGGALYFVADDGVHGRVIWRSDGTEAGTRMVRDLSRDSPGTLAKVYQLAATPTAVYASVQRDNLHELWRTDGTEAGTRKVAAPYPPYPNRSVFLGPLVPVGETLFFTGELAPADVRELWKTDGTEAGTTLVRQIPFELFRAVALGNLFVWSGDYDRTLWRSDGTAAGTYRVAPSPERIEALTPVGGTVFFSGSDPSHGLELFAFDGSTERLVRDIVPGPEGSEPSPLGSFDGRFLFSAWDADGKYRIWSSDGTAAGTRPLVDTGAVSSGALWLVEVGSRLFFAHASPEAGLELWSAGDCAPPGLQCPAPVTAEATSPAGAVVTYPPASFTGGAPPSEIQYDHPSGATFPLGATTVTATGQGARCTFGVTVRDTTAPALTCPPPQVAQAGSGSGGAAVEYPSPTATDAVSTPTVTTSQPSGGEFPVGVTDVEVTAADQAGNAARCTFTVTVNAAAAGDGDGGDGGGGGGCAGCSAPGGAAVAWALALLLPALRRRSSRPSGPGR